MKAAAIASSEKFFGTLMKRCSTPVALELGGALTSKKQTDQPQQGQTGQQQEYTIEPRMMEELRMTARKMASIGVTSCATVYATNRANFVLESLNKMNTASLKAVTATTAAASQYTAHSHPIFAYTRTVLSVLSYERDFAEDILSHQFRTVWGQIVEPVLERLTRTVEEAEHSISALCNDDPGSIYSYGFFITADIYDAFHSSLDKLDVITRLEVNKHSVFLDKVEASRRKQATLLTKALNDFLGLLQLEQAPSSKGMVKQSFPQDGTVHQVTGLVCFFVFTLMFHLLLLVFLSTGCHIP